LEILAPWSYLVLVLLIALIFGPAIRSWQRPRSAKDLAVGTPYKIYTNEFDQVVTTDDLPAKLVSISPDQSKGYLKRDQVEWDNAVSSANAHFQAIGENINSSSKTYDWRDTAVVILIDQSGSMKGDSMAWTSAAINHLNKLLDQTGAKTEVIGFTTAGWKGGFARQHWMNSGKPEYPGRLCALLHLVYKSFDDREFSGDAWRQMLNPDILRENIDGEALEFAEARLLKRPESRRVLMMFSDGAPVDDSTLTQNGPSFLYRHIIDVISRIQSEQKIELCAVGLNHRVDEWYSRSKTVSDGEAMVVAAIELLQKPNLDFKEPILNSKLQAAIPSMKSTCTPS
jgi:cobaltochelatase CobT